MFEHRRQPLLSRKAFFLRLLKFVLLAFTLVFSALGMGMLGYHELEGMTWIDALVNAAMILGGMGPVNSLHTESGKIFAAFYALFSGLVFLMALGVMVAPIMHRFLHHFHLDLEARR